MGAHRIRFRPFQKFSFLLHAVLTGLGMFLLAVALPHSQAAAEDPPSSLAPVDEQGRGSFAPIRVGLLVYRDIEKKIDELARGLRVLSAHGGGGTNAPPMQFEVAAGTYADVLHWIESGKIDLAAVTPGVAAKALALAGPDRWEVIALLDEKGPQGATTPTLAEGQVPMGRSVAVTSASSPITSIDALRQSIRNGAGSLLFVDPLSVSGSVAPRVALRQASIPMPPSAIRYSHSHTNSLRLLTQPAYQKAVAFVWDKLVGEPPPPGLRVLPFPELEALQIPPGALIARSSTPGLDRIRAVISHLPHSPQGGLPFLAPPNANELYATVQSWQSQSPQPPDRLERLGLDEVGEMLVHYSRSSPDPMRLAVVFSGGGAKCSYQVGAIRTIEEKLADLRAQTGDQSLDISLVVGTSGGAINSLPVALGVSKSASLQEKFENVWRSLDQREIIKPSFRVRANMVLWFVSVQLVFFFRVLRRKRTDPSQPPYRHLAYTLLILGAVEILLVLLIRDPWSLIGANPNLHRLWLWIQFGLCGSGAILIAVGLLDLLARRWKLALRPRALRALWLLSLSGIVILPILQGFTIFAYEPTLSEGTGIEETLIDRFAGLLDAKRKDENRPPSKAPVNTPVPERMRALSKEIVDQGLLARDLVLTASLLGERGIELPPDLYFWASSGTYSLPPQFGARGVSLAIRPDLLLDALIGSGSIFPVFPSRVLPDFPEVGQHVEIVDGSFAHRSPIEAAVLWGATHIILIQADSDELMPRGSFSSNLSAALTHLYDQAQLTDIRTKQRATVFTLTPIPPQIGLLDFAGTLISEGIKKGRREALGPVDDRGGYRKEVGLPRFVPVPM